MIGLVVKGGTAKFIEGPDPGLWFARALADAVRKDESRAWASWLPFVKLQPVQRPKPLTRDSLAWAHVFTRSQYDPRRLEPGPFDDELAGIVREIEAEQREVTGRDVSLQA